MKIKTKTLVEFLKKVRMTGAQEIKECILSFSKDGLKITATSTAKQSFITAWLKAVAFKDYDENFGNIATDDLPTITDVLGRFGEFIVLKKEGNLLTVIGDNKKVDIELVNETFLSTMSSEPNLAFVDTFELQAQRLKDVFKDVRLNKDAVIVIKTEPKKVAINNTGKYKFRNEINSDMCKGGADSTFGEPFIDATQELDGNLEISVGVNWPIKILEKTDESIITIIVAPRVSEE
jgi:hypothetical protein